MRLSTHRRAVALSAAAVVLPLLPVVIGGAPATAAAPAPATTTTTTSGVSFDQATPGRVVPVRGSGLDKNRKPARASLVRDGKTADITVQGSLSKWIVSFAGGSAAQQAAFTRATTTWSNLVASPVPITVTVTLKAQADGQVLGSAGPVNLFSTDTPVSGIFANTFYPVALANALSGQDQDPSRPDIAAEFNNDPTVFSFEGSPAAGEYDFETVALHELGHGLGFLGNVSAYIKPGRGLVGGWDVDAPAGEPRLPFIFDRRVYRYNPGPIKTLFSLGQDSAALGQALTTGDVMFAGPQLAELRICTPLTPKLYTPSSYVEGTSYSHLDEAAFPRGTVNALMTPFIDDQEVLHDPGPIVLAMLRDMGWVAQRRPAVVTVQQCAAPVVDAGTRSVVLKGTAPSGSVVSVFFRKRTEQQFVPRLTTKANSVGYWAVAFTPVDDWFYATAAAGQATGIAATYVRPTILGTPLRSFRRNTVVNIVGKGAPGTVVQLRFRVASTKVAGYPILRNVRVSGGGNWIFPLKLTETAQFIAVGVNGLSAPTRLYRAV